MSKTSKIRNGLPDLLKGFAVLLMIQVHLMELFAKPEIYASTIGKISLFLGGPPAAPLFMVIMGYYISAKKGLNELVLRAFKLIGIGIVLNISLNTHVLIKIYQGKFLLNPWEFVWGVDILFLAGISIIFISLLKTIFKNKWYLYLSTAIIISVVSPHIQNIFVSTSNVKYLLAYFGGEYSWSYFAFFPWFTYPLIGYSFKLIHQQYSDYKPSIKLELTTIITLSIILLFTLKWAINIASNLEIYYHHNIIFFAWIIAFIIAFTLIVKLIDKNIKSIILEYIKWIGKYVTEFYIIQWIVIGNIATAIYKTQSIGYLTLWYMAIIIFCTLFIRFILKKKITQN